jgi:hypothetical protein
VRGGAFQLVAILRALPPGRVWAGDRASSAAFAAAADDDDDADADDDLLFVHLLQRGMGCGRAPAVDKASGSASAEAWGGARCGRTIDIAGPLLHGLSRAVSCPCAASPILPAVLFH